MLAIEVQHSNSYAITKLLFKNGYRVYKHVKGTDVIFVKEQDSLLWDFFINNKNQLLKRPEVHGNVTDGAQSIAPIIGFQGYKLQIAHTGLSK